MAEGRPSGGRVVSTLRDGYWDRTDVIELADGSRRVRKATKGAAAPGPWSLLSLRNEIRYLQGLTGEVAAFFPRLLADWDDGEHVGYEMTFIEGAADVGEVVRAGAATQAEADAFQDRLAEVLFGLVHVEAPAAGAAPSLAGHVREAIAGALDELSRTRKFRPLVEAHEVTVNGRRVAGTRRAMEGVLKMGGALATLDGPPQVRLHGDCFLENVLLPRDHNAPGWSTRLTLVDPVSVAGVYEGTPLFDLVKYESYATGELVALRGEKIETGGFGESSSAGYTYRVLAEDPEVAPFGKVDWHGRLRAAYVAKYGEVDARAYDLLDGYFALVMALCTTGLHQEGRVLKGTIALNAAGGG